MRVTVICPAIMIEDANALMMALSSGPEDGNTFSHAGWRDLNGVAYSVASFEASEGWLDVARASLARPAWDQEPYVIDMGGAKRCQDLMVFWFPETDGDIPEAMPDRLLVVAAVAGYVAVKAAGLIDAEANI